MPNTENQADSFMPTNSGRAANAAEATGEHPVAGPVAAPVAGGGRVLRWLTGFMAAALIVAGCRTIDEMAPPVGPTMVDLGRQAGHPMDSLRRGRDIYLDQCIKCHTVEPVDGYTLTDWNRIIPDMAKETKLNPAQTADLRAYVLTAHQWMNSPAGRPGETGSR